MTNLTNDIKKERGFTIVELLVVIVVIGILAAITIVSYTGITARANTSSAQSAANSVLQKVGVYAVDAPTPDYPATLAAMTGAASTASYFLSGVTYNALGSAPTSPSYINFILCGTSGTSTAPANYAAITVKSGIKIGYWDYTVPAIAYLLTGTTSGNYLTFPVACFTSGS